MGSPQTVGIIGAGTMGAGIAQVCALAGLLVVMIDVDETRVGRGCAVLGAGIDRLVAKGKLSHGERDVVLARTRGTVDYSALRVCDFIVDAATESPELKLRILHEQVAPRAKPDAILATNTSAISITQLAAGMPRPQRFVGLHFFNPVPAMALVEVVRGRDTSDATVEAAVALAKRLGKTPVVVKDSPGFVVNRLLCPMLNEAALAFGEGVASARDIDEAMKLGCNHPIGPLALADLIGIDVLVAVMEVFQRDFDDPKYRPAPVLNEMLAAGRLGRKSGRGFYTYD